MTQARLAELCGITLRSQRNYEKGERSPDANYMAALVKAGADLRYVLTGQREGSQQPLPAIPRLTHEEEALLDNFRSTSSEGRKAIAATSAALAQPAKAVRRAS